MNVRQHLILRCRAMRSAKQWRREKADLVGRVYRRERALETGDLFLAVDGREAAGAASQKIILGGILNGGSVVAGCCELVGVLAQ